MEQLRSYLLWGLVGLTCFVYLTTLLIVFWIPCRGELLIGLCQIGRIIIAAIGLLILSVYFLLIIFFERRRKSQSPRLAPSLNTIGIIVLSLVFITIPISIFNGPLRNDPNLQPYSISALQQNGKEQIEFHSFSDTPVAQSFPNQGYLASGELSVSSSGTYSIHPIRPKGDVPIRVMTVDQDQVASIEEIYLDAGKTYQFNYFVEIDPDQKIGSCQQAYWNILWQIESIPIFPLYLFGQGIFAQVYPDDSGEFSFVTHINPEFRTDSYDLCNRSN